MITSINLRHFKCFASLRLPLKPLTLLTGINAAGKSSLIQSILLLQQTSRAHYDASHLLLNGPLVRIGRFAEAIDEFSGRNEFSIQVGVDDYRPFRWVFSSASRESLTAHISRRGFIESEEAAMLYHVDDGRFLPQITYPTPDHPELFDAAKATTKAIERLVYLATDRIGPRETYAIDVSLARNRDVGPQGEYTAWFIHVNREKLVHPNICRPEAAPSFDRQTEAWLAYFFPGAAIEVEPIKGANLVSLRIRTTPDGSYHRPQNVGYGLTHVLPFIAASLAAEPGQVVVIENPEAHLHPSAQAKAGEFLARVASAGVQIITETHSDHVLNGVRRAVREGLVQPENVAVHFFLRRSAAERAPQVISPSINKRGVVDQWPKGFFDQYDEDLALLTDWPSSP